jgi:hypothetical protein
MDRSLTPNESLALELIFRLLGETRLNRQADAWSCAGKYVDVALRAPKLSVLHADINNVLRQMAAVGHAPYEICTFKAGDRHYQYHKFPTSLSRETIRRAWAKSGMREIQKQYQQHKFRVSAKPLIPLTLFFC